LDPEFYKKIEQLRKIMASRSYMSAFQELDPLMFDGREFLFNCKTALHTDRQDPQLGWTVLVALGSFTGGDLSMPQLGLKVRFEPGDMVMLRGRVVQHEVADWEGGQRISVPHFTHTSL
jgi:hypothetical protein